ncbi:hypothetical protein NEOLEDRAFT_1124699 [Neolentinus lepideus HHB14362 ss-1]|uniref:Cytoplasmic tRNA 2-thiolation protein 2 n=1 Tax=Neolentinus lepideus HHB14362 ss-1 TaxID=1314782 RepID=A0A165N0R4_9AGAM|nr:hypothetical protein NEOLEDRAFT_1124699 [Neolentinus lepideus HHB14362 ss-1]
MSTNCGNPITETDAMMPRRCKFDRSKMCIKCKENRGNIVVRHAVYCKVCFVLMLNQKFKRSLEPTINPVPDGPRKKSLSPLGNLVIAFSGGLGSTVLLDLVHRGYISSRKPRQDGDISTSRKDPKNEMVWKEVRVCYVEVCGAFPGMRDRTDDVRRVVESYDGFEFVPMRVEDAFDERWWESVGGRPVEGQLGVDVMNEDLILSPSSNPTSPLSTLHIYLSSLPAPTAIPSTLQTLTRLLLLHTSRSTNSSHLVLGTCLTSLSISLISLVAQGGGFNIKEEVQEEWCLGKVVVKEDKGKEGRTVRIVRPLKDIGMKECEMYAWWSDLEVVGQETWPGAPQGIGGITKDFIIGLEKDYPSTVSTIARTCGKLAPKDVPAGICILCNRPSQGQVKAWKDRISIRSLSSSPLPSTSPAQPSLAPYLCYMCHTTLTSKSSKKPNSAVSTEKGDGVESKVEVPVPQWVGARITAMGREVMKDELKEFLLVDEDD